MAVNIVIFASGSGSNAEQIVKHFQNHPNIDVVGIFCNKPGAYVLERAKNLGIPSALFTRSDFNEALFLTKVLDSFHADYIVLAGFLLKVPDYLIQAFPDKIINIHPSLLPKFGGKGMFGHHVHEAVIQAGESHSGITIHLVNEHYDEGRILFQASCDVLPNDSPDELASRIHQLEHRYFPEVVESYISEQY